MRRLLLGLVLTFLMPVAPSSAQTLRLVPKVDTPTDGYDQVLARFAKPSGFDYAGLAADTDAKHKLNAFLRWAERMPEEAPLADWLNSYNALVLASVLHKLPLSSVMDDKGFFASRAHRVAGKMRTLDQIENDIVRPRFHDARVHFALNCAARSCPTLRGRAFRADDLEATLNALTRAALADEMHLKLTNRGVELSAIFSWFKADFERDAGSVRAFLRKYTEPAIASRITDELPLIERDYDWSLNQAR